MLRTVAGKVTWVRRATVFAVGLAVILVVLVGATSAALGFDGRTLFLGGVDRAEGISQPLIGGDAGTEGVLAVDPLGKRRPPPQGYAHITNNGNFDPARSKGVLGVTRAAPNSGVYCFDLAFVPKVAVGSPFTNNNAVVATATPPETSFARCPEGYRDAAAKTYAANTSAEVSDVAFQIVFR